MKNHRPSLAAACLAALCLIALTACSFRSSSAAAPGSTPAAAAPETPDAAEQPQPYVPRGEDPVRLRAAADAVLAEYAALTAEALESFDEAAHPELPWYTAAIANPVRNSLYYAWHDFDSNGTEELVISAGDDMWQQPMAIYAFDGEKMVYLCREQPLGERSSLCYFQDGLFAVRGSNGAAAGSVTLFQIAQDGYGTDLIEIMDYEYKDADTVVYTPRLGNVTVGEFLEGDYLRGFDVSLDYTLFAQRA